MKTWLLDHLTIYSIGLVQLIARVPQNLDGHLAGRGVTIHFLRGGIGTTIELLWTYNRDFSKVDIDGIASAQKLKNRPEFFGLSF